MTVCVPGVSGFKSETQPCPKDRPVAPAGRPKMLSAGRTMFSSPVSASVTGTDRPSTVTEGAVCASLLTAQARSWASVDWREVSPGNVLHSNEDAATKILVPGFTVHDGMPAGPERRDRAAEVEASGRGTAAAEWVLGGRCSEYRRPHRGEVGIEFRRRGGAGGGCGQAERHRGEQRQDGETENTNETGHINPPSGDLCRNSLVLDVYHV